MSQQFLYWVISKQWTKINSQMRVFLGSKILFIENEEKFDETVQQKKSSNQSCWIVICDMGALERIISKELPSEIIYPSVILVGQISMTENQKFIFKKSSLPHEIEKYATQLASKISNQSQKKQKEKDKLNKSMNDLNCSGQSSEAKNLSMSLDNQQFEVSANDSVSQAYKKISYYQMERNLQRKRQEEGKKKIQEVEQQDESEGEQNNNENQNSNEDQSEVDQPEQQEEQQEQEQEEQQGQEQQGQQQVYESQVQEQQQKIQQKQKKQQEKEQQQEQEQEQEQEQDQDQNQDQDQDSDQEQVQVQGQGQGQGQGQEQEQEQEQKKQQEQELQQKKQQEKNEKQQQQQKQQEEQEQDQEQGQGQEQEQEKQEQQEQQEQRQIKNKKQSQKQNQKQMQIEIEKEKEKEIEIEENITQKSAWKQTLQAVQVDKRYQQQGKLIQINNEPVNKVEHICEMKDQSLCTSTSITKQIPILSSTQKQIQNSRKTETETEAEERQPQRQSSIYPSPSSKLPGQPSKFQRQKYEKCSNLKQKEHESKQKSIRSFPNPKIKESARLNQNKKKDNIMKHNPPSSQLIFSLPQHQNDQIPTKMRFNPKTNGKREQLKKCLKLIQNKEEKQRKLNSQKIFINGRNLGINSRMFMVEENNREIDGEKNKEQKMKRKLQIQQFNKIKIIWFDSRAAQNYRIYQQLKENLNKFDIQIAQQEKVTEQILLQMEQNQKTQFVIVFTNTNFHEVVINQHFPFLNSKHYFMYCGNTDYAEKNVLKYSFEQRIFYTASDIQFKKNLILYVKERYKTLRSMNMISQSK